MSNTETDTPHEYAESRRYVCTSCDTVVRARWSQWGDGYPGYFSVGCDCTIVPIVPEMSQAETPEQWRVERPECCRGVDVEDLEEWYGGVSDYRCPDCGATYRWDGTMSTAPESEEQLDPPDDQQLLTDGGTDQHVERDHRLPEPLCRDCAAERDADYEHRGRFKNRPGRRTEVLCEVCSTKLGEMYRPVMTDGGRAEDDSGAPRLERESPYGDTPAEDVACAWCGAYRTLYGPLNFDGEIVEHGDFVCRPCAEKEGVEIAQ